MLFQVLFGLVVLVALSEGTFFLHRRHHERVHNPNPSNPISDISFIHNRKHCPYDTPHRVLNEFNLDRTLLNLPQLSLSSALSAAAHTHLYDPPNSPNNSPFGRLIYEWSFTTLFQTNYRLIFRTITKYDFTRHYWNGTIDPPEGRPKYSQKMWAATTQMGVACRVFRQGHHLFQNRQTILRIVVMFDYPKPEVPQKIVCPPPAKDPHLISLRLDDDDLALPERLRKDILTQLNTERHAESLELLEYSNRLSKQAQAWADVAVHKIKNRFEKEGSQEKPNLAGYGQLTWIRFWDWVDGSPMKRFKVKFSEPFKEKWTGMLPVVTGNPKGSRRSYTKKEWANAGHVGFGAVLKKVKPEGVVLYLVAFFDGMKKVDTEDKDDSKDNNNKTENDDKTEKREIDD